MACIMFVCMLPVNMAAADGDILIDAAHFPDETFRNFIATGNDFETKVRIDTNGNGSLSAAEIAAVVNINVGNLGDIEDLTGIEYFTALTALHCYNNRLTRLDISHNTMLVTLNCLGNRLTRLDLSNNTALKNFYCTGNSYPVPASPFDLTGLPEGFDLSNASNWQNGILDGNILTFNDVTKPVKYSYKCGHFLRY